MLLLMALLCLSTLCRGGRIHLMRSSKEVEFVSPIKGVMNIRSFDCISTSHSLFFFFFHQNLLRSMNLGLGLFLFAGMFGKLS